MFPRLSLVVCGWVVLAGCAAEEIDDGAPSASGNAPPSSGSGGAGSGGASSSTGGRPSAGATGSGVGNAPSTAGGGGAGTSGSPGTAGTGAGGAGSGSLGGAPAAAGTTSVSLPFTEDFEDGVADGFLPWNEDMMAGKWVIVSDGASKVYQPTAAVSELEFAVGGKTAWTDVALKVRVKLSDADSGAQVVVRFKDAKTYLFVEMAEGKYKLRGRVSGSTQDLVAPSPKPTISAGTWYTVGVTAKGTAVSLTLNDALIGSATADALIESGGVALGVAEGSAAFDDLSVTAAN